MYKTILLSLLGVAATVSAQSFTTSTILSTPTPTPSVLANSSQEFYIKTDLVHKDPAKARFDNLWLYSYHTGAGTSDVTFDANKTEYAAQAFINYTSTGVGFLTFALDSTYSWTMNADFESYKSFAPMTINVVEEGASGFFINETGLQWNTDAATGLNTTYSTFDGWLVCDWWHFNTPQLFWREKYPVNAPVLDNCAEVYLCPVYI